MQQESLADIEEGRLVAQLLADAQWRARITGIYGVPSDSEHYCEVSLDGLSGSPRGDVDLLLVPPGRAEDAIAIQAKRIRVSARAFSGGLPNKLRELSTLSRQANLLASIGFSQVYSFVLVVVDSRENNGGRHTYEGLTPKLRQRINEAISIRSLDSRVGLIHFEFVQPMDDRPLGAGTFGAHAQRLAQKIGQPSDVTAWVSRVVAARQRRRD